MDLVVYSFYWRTNDDKPHHFTQYKEIQKRQFLKRNLANLESSGG